MIENFLSCDWGTSSFRLRLVAYGSQKIIAEVTNGAGVAQAFNDWKKEQSRDRQLFFQQILQTAINEIEATVGFSLQGLPMVLSGMISSSIGMLELPYKDLPFKLDGSDLEVKIIEPENFQHRLIIISGARTSDDVMRGEETLLIGTASEHMDNAVFIFPGTHSKHVYVESDVATRFQTYMTGEVFHLLSEKSILSNSIEKGAEENSEDFFIRGIRDGCSTNLLNRFFHIRTNDLFKKNTKAQNFHYLSGLVMGYELKDLINTNQTSLHLVCGTSLKEQYTLALSTLGLSQNLQVTDADIALVAGQKKIIEHIDNS